MSNKISEVDLQFFDDDANLNIERKKSIYVSILYSYHYLNDADKKAFELLSLFPDGIDQENFKRMSQNVKAKDKKAPLITDVIIKSLENKSMIERNQGHIKLQSIIGKFAENKLNQRGITSSFYKNALDYNVFYANVILEFGIKNPSAALKAFHYQQKNFLKSIDYFDVTLVDHDEVLDYFDTLQVLFIRISSMKVFIRKLSEKSHVFNDRNKLCFDIILLQAQYYNGNFDNSFSTLQEKLPLDYLLNQNNNPSEIDRIIFNGSVNIYEMEGEEWVFARKISTNNLYYKSMQGRMLFVLGEINKTITCLVKKDFCFFEFQFSLGLLVIEDVDLYLENLYDKYHLERVQVSYVRSKVSSLEKSKIETLVSINPYTRGLKNLMLAFIEEDINITKKLYNQAIHNLEHIKYYYVEAIYFYSKFLHKHELEEFDNFYEMGLGLAKKHYYRFLQYRFEQIITPTDEEYDPKNYPLPDGVDFTEYLNQFSKKTSDR